MVTQPAFDQVILLSLVIDISECEIFIAVDTSCMVTLGPRLSTEIVFDAGNYNSVHATEKKTYPYYGS